MAEYADEHAFPFRLRQLERQTADHVKEYEEWRREVDGDRRDQARDIAALTDGFKTLTIAVNGLRKTLVGFAFTIAGAAVVFALSILAATGRL